MGLADTEIADASMGLVINFVSRKKGLPERLNPTVLRRDYGRIYIPCPLVSSGRPKRKKARGSIPWISLRLGNVRDGHIESAR